MIILIVKGEHVWAYTACRRGVEPFPCDVPARMVRRLIALTGGWLPARPSTRLQREVQG